ncbi:MAG: MOSC domain-containing protein [Methylocystaceae bacterium]|nr:MOSC domain-containing protein [Methylocystaceae bacterium]
MKQDTKISHLFIGHIQKTWPDNPPSAIQKTRCTDVLYLEKTGFRRDQQADTHHHGGLDKALHQYPQENYMHWQSEFGNNPQFQAGGFGENISTEGLTEKDLFIGDILSLGQAKVQITQGRQPCWKINAHTHIKTMALRMQETGRTGWYYRVLETGNVKIGDTLSLIDRLNEKWSVYKTTYARLNRLITPTDAKELSNLTYLTDNWRAAFLKMAQGEFNEDTKTRLHATL